MRLRRLRPVAPLHWTRRERLGSARLGAPYARFGAGNDSLLLAPAVQEGGCATQRAVASGFGASVALLWPRAGCESSAAASTPPIPPKRCASHEIPVCGMRPEMSAPPKRKRTMTPSTTSPTRHPDPSASEAHCWCPRRYNTLLGHSVAGAHWMPREPSERNRADEFTRERSRG